MNFIWHTFFFDPVYNSLVFFIDVVRQGDVGIAIICTVILVKLVILPISLKASRTQLVMRELEPKLAGSVRSNISWLVVYGEGERSMTEWRMWCELSNSTNCLREHQDLEPCSQEWWCSLALKISKNIFDFILQPIIFLCKYLCTYSLCLLWMAS